MNRLGYLCSEYPALSHTFISREIEILEKAGFSIASASMNRTKNLEKMGDWDQRRAAMTFVVKATSPLGILGALLGAVLGRIRFLPVLGFALKTAWWNGPRDLPKAMGYFVQSLLLDNWARREKLDHVHVHFANPAATVALIATRWKTFRFSLSVHGPDEFYDVEKNSLKEKVAEAVFVRCIGHFCRSQLMRLTPTEQWSKFHIVRCGLKKDEFVPRPARSGKAKNFLCVGRVCPSKGQAILIQAAALLRDRGLDFHLLCLGGGEDLETIRALVEHLNLGSLVTMAGPVGHDRVKAELAATDVFVLPSFAEGIPVALMEAMAVGVPVVSTAITGIPELIENGVDGFLTPASDVEALVGVIERLVAGTVDSAELARRSVEKVRTLYDVEANTLELGKLFTGLGAH